MFQQFQESQISNHNSFLGKDKRERLLKIEQKLESITNHKQNLVKNQLEEEITKRVLEAELRCTEEIRNLQMKARELKENLSQMKSKENEHIKKCQLSNRARIGDIRQLQKRVLSILNQQSSERKMMENSLVSFLQLKDKQLTNELARIKQIRIQAVNHLEEQLSDDLPEINLRIQIKAQEIQVQLETLHQKIRTQIDLLKEKIQIEEKEREKGLRNLMEFIIKLTQQIKNDLRDEKKQRQTSKVKLISLFQSAYGKLNLL